MRGGEEGVLDVAFTLQTEGEDMKGGRFERLIWLLHCRLKGRI